MITSTYNLANLFNVNTDNDGNTMYNLNDNIVIEFGDNSTNNRILHTVGINDSWYSISYRYYGTVELWWTILKINNITNAFIQPVPGQVITLISPSVITSVVSGMKS